MATGPAFETYKELLLFLGTAGVIVPLFARLQMSPVFGFLATGVILGPFVLGALAAEVPWLDSFAISNVEQIAHLSEFGIAFLLFMLRPLPYAIPAQQTDRFSRSGKLPLPIQLRAGRLPEPISTRAHHGHRQREYQVHCGRDHAREGIPSPQVSDEGSTH